MGLFDELRKYRRLIEEADAIYEQLRAKGENPSLPRVAIPMLYRRMMEQNEQKPVIPDHYATALSFIMGREYHGLGLNLLTKNQQEMLDAYRNVFSQRPEESNEKK